MPNSGRIRKIILKTPYDHSKSPFIAGGYDVVVTSFLKIEAKTTWGEKLVKSYFCNLYYDKIRGKKPDPLKDKVRKLVMYDVSYEYHEIKTDIWLNMDDVINIRTDLAYPKAYEIFKDNDIYIVTFLIELYPLLCTYPVILSFVHVCIYFWFPRGYF